MCVCVSSQQNPQPRDGAMTIKCSVYIATSVDGFIARPDGAIDWLERPEYTAAELNGLQYDPFIATVDAIVMGAKHL